VGHEDRVAALCTNSHVMLELHHAVPMRGAALVSVNIRLSPAEMAEIIWHSGASLLVEPMSSPTSAAALAGELDLPLVIAGGSGDGYEAWLADADPAGAMAGQIDERQLLAINYTSGTTGRPKGVMYHHRGAYLQATAMAYHARLGPGARYLWTLPMFHCNGWCFTWAVTAAGGTHVCLRAVDPAEIWRLLRTEGITHFSAAPTVLTMIAEDDAAGRWIRGARGHRRRAAVGHPAGAPGKLRLAVTHLYGLTETYGPLAINEWQPEWDDLEPDRQAALRARQGAPNIIARPLRVLDDQGRTCRPTARRSARSRSAATTSCSATTATTRRPGRSPALAAS
jgi:Acyl-CoA synthetases (AMP-forming)/AMP-acid ligases II